MGADGTRAFVRCWLGRGGLAVAFVAAFGLSATAAGAETLQVSADGGSDIGDCISSPCQTIQYAIDQGSGGDTIEVAAGSYAEQLTIDESLTLSGPNAGIDPNTGADTRGPEAIVEWDGGIAIRPQVSDISIDGFTVSSDDAGLPIYTGTGDLDGLRIANNIVGSGVRAITIETGADGVVIERNLIEGKGYGIILAFGTYEDLAIDANVIEGPVDHYAIFNGGGDSVLNGFELTGNTIRATTNIGGSVVEGTVSGNTIDVDSPGDLGMQIDLHQSTVEDNSFAGHGVAACLQLFGSQFDLDPSEDAIVSDNSFEGCNAYAVQLSPDIDGIAITRNSIVDSYDGVNTRDVTPWDLSGKDIRVFANRIVGSSHRGASNTVEGTLDASGNWWGCNTGPTTTNGAGGCDGISAGVDADPWLMLTASASPSSILTGASSTIGASIDTDSEGDPALPPPDGAAVSFASILGSLVPASASLTDGTASAVFTAGSEPGEAGVGVEVDGQQVTVPLSIGLPPAQPATTPPATTPPVASPPVVVSSKKDSPKLVPATGRVRIATVVCPAGTCTVVPKAPRLKIGGGVYKVRVKVSKRVTAGEPAAVSVILPRKARRALIEQGKGRLIVKLRLASSDGTIQTMTIRVKLRTRAGR